MKVTIQYFDIEIDGKGVFVVYDTSYEDGNGTFVPTFGYGEDGDYLGERKRVKEGLEYAEIKQEWIDKEINNLIDDFVGQKKHDGKDINEDTELFVAIIKRSDIPNQVGMCYSETRQTVPEFSVKVTENTSCIIRDVGD